jgi:hypothetical protein
MEPNITPPVSVPSTPAPQMPVAPQHHVRWPLVGAVAVLAIGGYVALAAYQSLWPFPSAEAPIATFTPRPTPTGTTSPTAGWKDFSSKYFTLSFKTSAGFDVYDSRDLIVVSEGAYIPSELGNPGNGFLFIQRYSSNYTKTEAMSRFKQFNKNVLTSTVTVGGMPFTRMDGTSTPENKATFEIFFDEYSLTAIESGLGQSQAHLGLAEQILSTFQFTK